MNTALLSLALAALVGTSPAPESFGGWASISVEKVPDQVVTGTRDMGQAAAGAAVRMATAAARPFFPGASPNNDDERKEGATEESVHEGSIRRLAPAFPPSDHPETVFAAS